PSRTTCGCSTTTGSSFRWMEVRAGARSPGWRPPPSASPPPSIRSTAPPPGSCPPSRTSCAFPPKAGSSSPARATAVRASRCWPKGCRRSTPMIASTAMGSTSTRPAPTWHSARPRAACGSPTTRAIAGRASPSTSPRSMPCASCAASLASLHVRAERGPRPLPGRARARGSAPLPPPGQGQQGKERGEREKAAEHWYQLHPPRDVGFAILEPHPARTGEDAGVGQHGDAWHIDARLLEARHQAPAFGPEDAAARCLHERLELLLGRRHFAHLARVLDARVGDGAEHAVARSGLQLVEARYLAIHGSAPQPRA